MKIVIEIDEERYNDVKNQVKNGIDNPLKVIIANGTPLPKGHGRLIEQPTDADIAETIGGQNDFADCIRDAVVTVFENAKTVVDADRGDAE